MIIEEKTISLVDWLKNTQKKNFSFLELLNYLKYAENCPRVIYNQLDGRTLREKAGALERQLKKMNYETFEKKIIERKQVIKNKILVPDGTIVTPRNSTSKYIIRHVEGDINRVTFTSIQHSGPFMTWDYQSSEYLNDGLKKRRYIIKNMSEEEIDSLLGKYSNVVKCEKFKNTNSNNNGMSLCSILLEGGGGFTIVPGATYNCQVTTIGGMDSLLLNCTHPKLQLCEIYKYSNRPLLLCDINKYQVDLLESLIGRDYIHSRTNYISSNKSNMCLILINIQKLQNNEGE